MRGWQIIESLGLLCNINDSIILKFDWPPVWIFPDLIQVWQFWHSSTFYSSIVWSIVANDIALSLYWCVQEIDVARRLFWAWVMCGNSYELSVIQCNSIEHIILEGRGSLYIGQCSAELTHWILDIFSATVSHGLSILGTQRKFGWPVNLGDIFSNSVF